jgi:arginyl-tRNA synthetase
MREYGQRFALLEGRLTQEIAELKTEVRRRLDSLEAFTRQEANQLDERLQTERRERTESADQVSRSLADSVKSLEKCLMQSDERQAKDLRELRQLTLDRLKSLLDDLTVQINTRESFHNRQIEELRANAVDRFAFAGLLTEVAVRIRESGAAGLGEASDGGTKR